MTTTNKTICLSLLAIACLTACSSDDKETEQPRIPLVVNVSEIPMTDNTANAPTTRGYITDNTSFNEFYMNYSGAEEIKPNYTLTKVDKGWSPNSGFWPTGDAYSFYAYNYTNNDGNFNWKGGNPYVNFIVEEEVADQKDFVVAETTTLSSGSPINLTFTHACAAVQFSICMTSNLSTALSGYTIEINSVKLCNVVKNGDYYYRNKGWDISKSTTTDYTLNTTGFTLTTTPTLLDKFNGDKYLFMIPQTLTPWNKTAITDGKPSSGSYICLQCKIYNGSSNYLVGSSGEYGNAYLAVGDTFAQGKRYHVTIQVGTALRDATGAQVTTLIPKS